MKHVAGRAAWVAALFFTASLWKAAHAAPADGPGTRLRMLQQKLDAERQRLSGQRQNWKLELAPRIEARDALAANVVDLAAEKVRLNRRLEELDSESREMRDRAARLQSRLASMLQQALTTTEQLDIHLRETPGERGTPAELVTELTALHEGQAGADQGTALPALVDLCSRVYSAGTNLSVAPLELRTATGGIETVTLLQAGYTAFAYATEADERVGFALTSPADADGYRWHEKLSKKQTDLIRTAFDAVAAGDPKVNVPIEVTGRLRIEGMNGGNGIIAITRTGGPVIIPLLIMAALAAVLIVERLWYLSRQYSGARGMADDVLRACAEGDVEAARSQCLDTGGVVARTLGACLDRCGESTRAMEDGIEEQMLHELPQLHRFLGGIAVIGAVAPLVGLLGTVTGIIKTFAVIRIHQDPSPSLLAGGISEALVTTAAGLIIAIPVLLLHSLLSGRVERIISDTEEYAARLLNTLNLNKRATGGDGKP